MLRTLPTTLMALTLSTPPLLLLLMMMMLLLLLMMMVVVLGAEDAPHGTEEPLHLEPPEGFPQETHTC